jgi:beta-galactosidase
MDIMRLPKFSFYFYQSQVEPVNTNAFNRPMIFIANYWQNTSDTVVKIYSNCEEVELLLNGKSIGRRRPDEDQYSTNLKNPPFTFHVQDYHPGELTAIGYIKQKKVVQHQRKTPGEPAGIKFRVDYSGRELKAGQNDVVFVYADIVDANGTIVYDAADPVQCTIQGDAVIVGDQTRAAEAGTATFLVKAGSKPGVITITAKARELKSANLILTSK